MLESHNKDIKLVLKKGINMNLIAINELKSPRLLKEKLANQHELLLTSSGKPIAVIMEIQNAEDAEAEIQNIKDARSRLALTKIRESAQEYGSDKMNLSDINEIIKKVRAGRK